MRTVACIVTLFLLAATASAGVWYVDQANTSGPHTGTSWANAFTTVQEGIDAAESDGGGEVWVAASTYDEARVSFPHGFEVGNTGSIIMKEGVHCYGGFTGTETEREERDWEANETILDGGTARGGESAYHVIVGSDSATLDGFTVTGGKADGSQETGRGGGMYNSSYSPVISRCKFEANSASEEGGGIYNIDSSPMILSCVFSSNFTSDTSGGQGGGISNRNSSPMIRESAFVANTSGGLNGLGGAINNRFSDLIIAGCLFTSNSATELGGGIRNADSSLALSDTKLFANRAEIGGGIHNERSSASITRCSFIGNSVFGAFSPAYGGGIFNGDSSLTVTQCTFIGNSASVVGPTARGGGLYSIRSTPIVTMCTFTKNSAFAVFSEESASTISRCILWDNSGEIGGVGTDVRFSNVAGGWPGAGNIDVEPQFVLAPESGVDGEWGTEDDVGDLRLRATSPCIDVAGTTGLALVDLAGTLRPQGDAHDMGAYEYLGMPTENLTLVVNGPGAIEGVPEGVYPVANGTVLEFGARPELGSRFDHWEGALSGVQNPQSLLLLDETTVIAVFEPGIPNILTGVVTNFRNGQVLGSADVVVSEDVYPGRELASVGVNAQGLFIAEVPAELSLEMVVESVDYFPAKRTGILAPATVDISVTVL